MHSSVAVHYWVSPGPFHSCHFFIRCTSFKFWFSGDNGHVQWFVRLTVPSILTLSRCILLTFSESFKLKRIFSSTFEINQRPCNQILVGRFVMLIAVVVVVVVVVIVVVVAAAAAADLSH